jgi:hypothetical protein
MSPPWRSGPMTRSRRASATAGNSARIVTSKPPRTTSATVSMSSDAMSIIVDSSPQLEIDCPDSRYLTTLKQTCVCINGGKRTCAHGT